MIELQSSLDRPECPGCGSARIRPVETVNGDRLRFDCPNPDCRWSDTAPLPSITKTIIYLDTSTAINMASALANQEGDSPWIRAYGALRDAAADQAICCAGSSILREEAELGWNAEAVVRLSRDFGDPGVEHQATVRERQVLRALEAFLDGGPATQPLVPDDAFGSRLHVWLPELRIDAYMPMPEEIVEHRRRGRDPLSARLAEHFGEYERQGLDRHEIVEREREGLGEGIKLVGLRAIAARLNPDAFFSAETDSLLSLGIFGRNTLDRIVAMIAKRGSLEYPQAVERAVEFLDSEHVRSLPMNEISAQLHAELALSIRGQTGRRVRPSDVRDIDHLATYMPYVDIFIADRYFTDVCNRLGLGESYSTTIRRLGEGDVDEFIEEIGAIVADAPQARLSQHIRRLIAEGGYREEMAQRMKDYLRARGIDTDEEE